MVRRWFRIVLVLVSILFLLVVLVFGAARTYTFLRETHFRVNDMPAEGRLVPTEMGAIYVEELGPGADAPVVLFAHGTAAWSRLWQPVLTEVAEAGYHVIAFDMPPFGFSDRDPAGAYDRVTQAQRVLALTEALEVRPILVAHSFGAGPAVEAAMMEPEAFAGLVIVNGALGLRSYEADRTLPIFLRPLVVREALASVALLPFMTQPLLRQMIYVKEGATPEVAAVLQAPTRLRGTTRAFADWLPSLLVPPQDAQSTRPEAYQVLTLPTRIIWGREDTITPLPQGQEIAALVPGSGLLVLDGVGHIPQIEAPSLFIAALVSQLGTLAPR
jgi:pimeloyl-ACP methyl ester carboxylesterase